MTARRSVINLIPNCSPRSSVDQSLHPDVDAVIKTLKICTRRIQVTLSSHKVELQILEKLHYKGNNQHRTALFWRRVVDIRRCSRRISEVGVDELVTKLRLSFWGNIVQNPKLLKGSWTHVPDSNTVRAVLQQFNVYRKLVHHSQDRLLMAHNQFNLDLQTGAFLQLILVLTAVASRLHILLDELGSALDQCSNACMQLREVLDPSLSKPPSVARIKAEADQGVSTSAAPPAATEDVKKDSSQSTYPTEPVEISSQPQLSRFEEVVSVENLESHNFMFNTEPNPADRMPIARSTVTRIVVPSSQKQNDVSAKRKREVSKPRVPQKKKKKDEIDDIFDF